MWKGLEQLDTLSDYVEATGILGVCVHRSVCLCVYACSYLVLVELKQISCRRAIVLNSIAFKKESESHGD